MINTPHINLKNEIGFAKTVLMPGDPLRTKMIAEEFLENAVLINDVRGMLGYTGFYKGKEISLMSSGMGIPSMSIYAHELYSVFNVENIIRIGTAGSLSKEIMLRDVVAGIGAHTNSNVANQLGVSGNIAPTCSFDLLSKAKQSADELGFNLKIGNLFCTDNFYDYDENCNKKWADLGALAVEMESAGLYLSAMRNRKNALTICTISDLALPGESECCTAEERQNSFKDMVKIALETALKI